MYQIYFHKPLTKRANAILHLEKQITTLKLITLKKTKNK